MDEATLRVFPDAVVEPNGDDTWIAVGRATAFAGEMLILDIQSIDSTGSEVRQRLPVCVIDSRPIIVEGEVRYRLLLHSGAVAPALFEQRVGRG